MLISREICMTFQTSISVEWRFSTGVDKASNTFDLFANVGKYTPSKGFSVNSIFKSNKTFVYLCLDCGCHRYLNQPISCFIRIWMSLVLECKFLLQNAPRRLSQSTAVLTNGQVTQTMKTSTCEENARLPMLEAEIRHELYENQ